MARPLTMTEAREKDYARILRRSKPWMRRAISGWYGFKRGVAWVMLGGGLPAKTPVYSHGIMDEWPYHIAFCDVVSMDGSLRLRHRRLARREWWDLVDKKGSSKWRKSGIVGKVQTVFRRKPNRNKRMVA